MNLSSGHEYVLAWAIYAVAGIGASLFWWKLTGFLKQRAWRDLLRGVVIVLIYTPWYIGEAPDFYAPAVVVLLMDLLLEGVNNGLQGGVALLVSLFVMLLVLTVRQFFYVRPKPI